MPVNKEVAREKLILAGERLVARHGLEGLSLRKVNLEAGQKNTSAALYHFGSRAGLLLATFDYRLEHTDQRRHQLLDEDESDLRALIRAWVLPDVEEITEAEGGTHHARFMAIVCNHPELNFDELWDRPHASSFRRLAFALRRLLPELPETIFSMRFGMAMMQSIYAIADQERLLAAGNQPVSSALFVSHLIDSMEALFMAPLSKETQQELERVSATKKSTVNQ
jgi:AcrR family transcriptional regulator